jgi:hypothetical protein
VLAQQNALCEVGLGQGEFSKFENSPAQVRLRFAPIFKNFS